MIVVKMQPDIQEVVNIREENGLIPLIFFTGEDTYLYQEEDPHAVYVEVREKKFVWWKLKYKYVVKYLPYTDKNQHCTWDPEKLDWGVPLDDIIYMNDIS